MLELRSPRPAAAPIGGAAATGRRTGALLYARVSTDRQADDGLGVDVQLAAGRAWCREHGRRVAGVYVDRGVSGTNELADREALADALAELRARPGRELVVYRLDRLARDMVLQEQLLAEIRRAGGRLRSTSATEDAFLDDDPADPARALVRQVLGAVAAYERAMIRLRMRGGLDRKRAAGGYAGGRPPYGHRAVAGELEPQPELVETRRLIRRLRGRGHSYRQIAAELTERGIPTAAGRPTWHPQAVARVLAHDTDR